MLPAVLAGLEANADVIAAVGIAVGGAVMQLLGDTALWQAIDTAMASLITNVLVISTVQQALNERVATAGVDGARRWAARPGGRAQVADAVVGFDQRSDCHRRVGGIVRFGDDRLLRLFGFVQAFSTAAVPWPLG